MSNSINNTDINSIGWQIMRLKRTRTKQNGFILVVILSLLMAMVVLLVGFNHKSLAGLRAADDLRRSKEALNCARAGLNIAIAAVRTADDIQTNKKILDLLSGRYAFDIGGGKCLVTAVEENGKLNINLLKDKAGKINRTRIDQLLRLVDLLNREFAGYNRIGYGIVPSIIDWTDCDDEVTTLSFVRNENSGTESTYYDRLSPPYRCKNGLFDTAGELLLVRGIKPQIFERVRDYVTVCGDGQVNINSAPEQVIASLSEEMDAALAKMIVERRNVKPFDSAAELQDVPGMTDGIYSQIKQAVTIAPTERYYRIRSQPAVGHISCTIEAVLKRNTETKNVEVILYKEL
jgi:general secretion pathway protein K